MAETPPSLIGTSFGYHFTSTPRTVERRGSRQTLPRGNGRRKVCSGNGREDLSRHLWTRWMDSVRGEEMGRTQSEIVGAGDGNGREVERTVSLRTEDTQSDIVDARGSWNRARGNSVV